MAKSSAFYVAAKRQRARELGLCITCCKRRPDDTKATCTPCSMRASRRVIDRRVRLRERAKLQHVVRAHEEAGDLSREHHVYEDAAQHYQDALNVSALDPSDRLRISEKLAYVLSLGRNSQAAAPLFDRALEKYINEPGEATKTVEILLQRARHLWRSARMVDAIPFLAQAIEVAQADGTPRLCVLAKSRMADFLIGLERYEEASVLINAVSEILEERDAASTATYYTQKGMLAAERGNITEFFKYFDLAVDIAQTDPDIINIINIWTAYAGWAASLTDINVSHACFERGLLIARRYHAVTQIPRLCLGYAASLMAMGHYGAAHGYLIEALSYEAKEPVMNVSLAQIGIPIALHVGDKETLTRCALPSALELAFQSGVPNTIANTAAAFAEWHYADGRQEEAQLLIHRVIETVKKLFSFWIFPIIAAKCGELGDLAHARKFLELRAEHSSADLALACTALFDAHVAQRKGLKGELHKHVRDAVKRFTVLGWHGYADKAHTLAPEGGVTASAVRERVLFADILALLTPREREVAALMLKGLTNRQIAVELTISPHTVDTHVNSIMNGLGIRSRHQLADVLEKS